MLAKQEALERLIELVTEVQQGKSGREIPREIDERTLPIGDLPGFDSLNGIELTLMLPDELSWSGENLCVSEDGKRALSIGEMVNRLLGDLTEPN